MLLSMTHSRRLLVPALIALMVWLPSAMAWASCCAVAMASSDSTVHHAARAQDRPQAAPCHGPATEAEAVHIDPPAPQATHADGSDCAHGVGCTLATAVASAALSMPAWAWPPADPQWPDPGHAPDAPVESIDHPPSLS